MDVTTCSECGNPAKIRGYCQRHYDWARHAGIAPRVRSYTQVRNGHKTCSICQQNKPVTEFNKAGGNGYHMWCKECQGRIRRERYAKNPNPYKAASRRAQIKYKYGITAQRYFELVKSQDGCCALCGDPATGPTSLHVDHDHRCCAGERSCGKCIRGLLCLACNSLLGQAKDNPQRLKKAIAYLERVMPLLR